MIGKGYRLDGHNTFSSVAGWNSIDINNTGKRTVTFDDGYTVHFNTHMERINSSFMGTPQVESIGAMNFYDSDHRVCSIELGQFSGLVGKKTERRVPIEDYPSWKRNFGRFGKLC